jgi:hypothetical protein
MLPQRGHLGRPNFWVATTSVLQAHCKSIVDLLDVLLTAPQTVPMLEILHAMCGAAATPL